MPEPSEAELDALAKRLALKALGMLEGLLDGRAEIRVITTVGDAGERVTSVKLLRQA